MSSRLLAFTAAVLPGSACAQWHTLPKNPAANVYATDWYVAHDTGNGIAVLSAVAPAPTIVSPAGSTFVQRQAKGLVLRENPTTVRGFSALHNASAVQTVSANTTVLTDDSATSCIVLRAYSAFTNTWASQPLTNPPNPVGPWRTGRNVGAHADDTQLHAYSAHLGAWFSHTVDPSAAPSLAGVDCVAHFRSSSGDYLAFSALLGTWATSPALSLGPYVPGFVVASANSCVFSVGVTDPVQVTNYRNCAYSARAGQWTLSPNSFGPNTSTSWAVQENSLRFTVDLSGAVVTESFGALSGWQTEPLAGTSTALAGIDYQAISTPALGTMTWQARSGLVAGSYASVTHNTGFGVGIVGTFGSHLLIVRGGATLPTSETWGFSARTGTFAGPVAQPLGTGLSEGTSAGVHGFVVQGALGVGTNVQAFSARGGAWVAGPTVQPGEIWTARANGVVLVAQQELLGARLFHVFDEHSNAWQPPLGALGTPPSVLGPTCFLFEQTPGSWTAYSAQRGDWATIQGVGSITPGGITTTQNLVWFTDSNQNLVVFTTTARAQTWTPWPQAAEYTNVASTGTRLGYSLRGSGTEYALAYAAIDRPPSPITLPGIGGSLDLDPAGLVQVAGPGLFGANGVHPMQLQFGGLVPPGIRVSLQLVTVDVTNGAITVHDRATDTFLF